MDNAQKEILVGKVVRHFGLENAEAVLRSYPISGPNSICNLLDELDKLDNEE